MGNFDESDATSYAEINRPNCLILGRFAEKQGSNRFGRLILASRKLARRACGKSEGGIQGTRGFVKPVNATGSSSET
jgi:hypothetical protein